MAVQALVEFEREFDRDLTPSVSAESYAALQLDLMYFDNLETK